MTGPMTVGLGIGLAIGSKVDMLFNDIGVTQMRELRLGMG